MTDGIGEINDFIVIGLHLLWDFVRVFCGHGGFLYSGNRHILRDRHLIEVDFAADQLRQQGVAESDCNSLAANP